MSAYRRNSLVGLVMLGALVTLAWMIIQFGGALANPFAPTQIHFRLVASRADGVSDGTAVMFRGVATGRVERAFLHDINNVWIDASVDATPALPANLTAVIRPNGLIGGASSIVLDMQGPQPVGELKEGQVLTASYSGLDLLPPEVSDLAATLRATVEQFRQAHVIEDFDSTVKRFGELAASIDQITGQPATQTDLKSSLANIRQSSDDLRKFTSKLDQLSADAGATITEAKNTLSRTDEQVNQRMIQIARLLDTVNAITTKVNDGQGTAGQLVNDPQLYASLVDTAKELDTTVKDLKRLIEQWEQEGVSLKLK